MKRGVDGVDAFVLCGEGEGGSELRGLLKV